MTLEGVVKIPGFVWKSGHWSGRGDSNSWPPGSGPGTLTKLSYSPLKPGRSEANRLWDGWSVRRSDADYLAVNGRCSSGSVHDKDENDNGQGCDNPRRKRSPFHENGGYQGSEPDENDTGVGQPVYIKWLGTT